MYEVNLRLQGDSRFDLKSDDVITLAKAADAVTRQSYPEVEINVASLHNGIRRAWCYQVDGFIIGYANIVSLPKV
jgi:hypothetical protein